MDMSFFRRQRIAPIDIGALLARTSAAQEASPTARAQVRLQALEQFGHRVDPQVALFAEGRVTSTFVLSAASFAEISTDIFRPRQPS
jgi:hypothetical protein